MEDQMPEGDIVAPPLSDEELRHMNVRRIQVGEHIALCAAGGNCWEVEVKDIDESSVKVRVIEKMPIEKLPNLTLVQGVSKGDRMGSTIRQTTELGIQRIIPFLSERTIVRLAVDEGARKGTRWRRIALSAAKQSGRSILPIVEDPTDLDEICRILKSFDCVVICWEEADKDAHGNALSIGDALSGMNSESRVALVIGPEGGLTKTEVDTIKGLGDFVKVVTLGDLILRTETAGTVATALCMYQLGGLGNHAVK
ncbi:MAG: RsmE family RNA methyltransferase [Coriobacteriales bacterium]